MVEITNLDPHDAWSGCWSFRARSRASDKESVFLRFRVRAYIGFAGPALSTGSVPYWCSAILLFSARRVSSATCTCPLPPLLPSSMRPRSSGVVYIDTLDGRVAAYQAHNGQLLWRRQLASSGFLVPTAQVLYRFTSSAANGNIEALKASDGSLLWRQQVPHGRSASQLTGARWGGVLQIGT